MGEYRDLFNEVFQHNKEFVLPRRWDGKDFLKTVLEMHEQKYVRKVMQLMRDDDKYSDFLDDLYDEMHFLQLAF